MAAESPDRPENPGDDPLTGAEEGHPQPLLVPLPSSISSAITRPSTFRVLIPDEVSIQRLLEDLLEREGLSVRQAAKQMGVTDEAVRQYIKGRRASPSLVWFLKFANLCGAEVILRRRSK